MSDPGAPERLDPVPAQVLASFGLTGQQQQLPGGRGLAVRVDDAVLVPAPDTVASTWGSELAERLRSPDVHLPRPLRSGDGRWVVDGWSASEHADGVDSSAARRPLPEVMPDQLVHGDLTGNVLLPPREGHGIPAVIDLSPYWRPTAAGAAIAVADGLLWHHAGPELIDLANLGPCGAQLLVRALLFRLLALDALNRDQPTTTTAELPAHQAAARLVLDLLADHRT